MELKLGAIVASLCLVLVSTYVKADKGYILTCPRSLEMNAINTLKLRLYEVDAPGNIKVQLHSTEEGNDTLIAEKEYQIDEGENNVDLNLTVPLVDNYNAKLRVSGTFETEDEYSLFGEETIYLRSPKSRLVLIQTDKPMYKPGQEVKFRVLLLDRRLRLVSRDQEGDIWIEDPKGSRLAQWKGVPLGNGIKQLEFPLSEEPNLGVWSIHASINNDIQTANFDVKEYVLPKFEVTIKPPNFVLATANSIPVEICAKYTYGEPVDGMLKLNVSLEKYHWGNDKMPTVETETEIEGCYEHMINVSLIDTESYYSYRRIEIVATVIEKGTEVEIKSTNMLERVLSPLNMNFQQEQRQYFKPGLPYIGKLKVTNPDNTPAPDEPVEICSTVDRERILSGWFAKKSVKNCANFTSNEEGLIEYILPPQNVDSVRLQLEAKSLKYVEENYSQRVTLSRPQAQTTLSPWFSPSGSHIQIQSEKDPFPCGKTKDIKILYTSKEEADYKIYYQVFSKSQIVYEGTIDESFTLEDDVSDRYKDQEQLVNVEIQVEPTPPCANNGSKIEDEDCPSAREAKYVPPIGEAGLSLEFDSSMGTTIHLLVYYIRDDRETVADSQKFTVEKCFQNKVGFNFGDEVKQPGERTSIKVSASPNSLCGIKVVDKSISLMDSRDQITKEEVFNILDRMDDNIYYTINHCNGIYVQPGLRLDSSRAYGKHILPPARSSPYEDALSAFENSGNIAISDFILMTRPCKSRPNNGYGVYDSAVGMRIGGGVQRPVALASTAARPGSPPRQESNVASKQGFSGGGSGTKSVVELRNFFPETWLFKMVPVGEEGEQISKEVLPHTITEWLGSAVCVNNEDGLGISDVDKIKGFQAFFLSFTLPYSVIRGEKFWLTMTVFNYIDKALPITVTLEDSPGYQLTSESINGDICLEGQESKTLRVQVQATTLGTLNFTVKGQTADSDICGDLEVSDAIARDAVQNNLRVEAEGFPQETVESIMFCPRDAEDGEFKKTFVIEEPENLVPDSARAFFIITGDIMGPAISNIDNLVVLPRGCGEQNMIRFTPNVFVLEYLSATGKLTDAIKKKAINNLVKGAQRQMKYRHADGSFSAFGPSDKEGSIILTAFVVRSFSQADKYISIDYDNLAQALKWITSKQQENGCYPEVGRTVDRELKGGMNGQVSTGLTTAYVLSSLIIAGYKNETAIKLALTCMKEDESDMTPYKASLYAYTYALAGDDEASKDQLFYLNERANKTGDIMYFKNINGSKSIDVETASYVVLAILTSNGSASDATPIIRWMSQNRNSRGGFYSTQDTVLGLEALSKFATKISSSAVDLSVATDGALEKLVHINEDNKILVREYKVADVPSEITVEATGSGCGLMQAVLRYNTITPPEKRYFSLNVNSQCENQKCKRATVSICTSYLPEGKVSNMAIVEVKMVSGMSPTKDSLEKLKQDSVLELKRYDIDNNNLIFYFYQISNKQKCFTFFVEQVFQIDESKPATAKVYDYYAKENSASTDYSIKECESESCNEEE